MNVFVANYSIRARLMMAFMLIIIAWGVILTVVIDKVFRNVLMEQNLSADVIAYIAREFILTSGGMTLLGLVLFYFIARFVAQTLTEPLQELMTGVESLGGGDLSTRVTIDSEDEFGQLAQAFNRMATQLSELDRMKSEFVSTVSHELRTPVACILGFAELLQINHFTAEEMNEYLQIIYRKAETLTDLIEGLLDISRMEAGGAMRLDESEFDLGTLISGCLEHYRYMEGRNRFILRQPERPLLVVADRLRIERVFDNLLSNAIKYSPEGSLIEIDVALHDREACVTVTDQGIGMSKSEQQQACEKFFRADGSNTAIGGVGLGLSIAYAIVAAHRGRILIESDPGHGSRISFCLPVERLDALDGQC